jgi:hypothetical protein
MENDQILNENQGMMKKILNNKLVRIVIALLFFLFIYKINICRWKMKINL